MKLYDMLGIRCCYNDICHIYSNMFSRSKNVKSAETSTCHAHCSRWVQTLL